MAGDLNKPILGSLYANVLAEIRDNFADQAKLFDGTSTANIPAKAKRLVWSTGKFEQYNGSTWDTLALNGMTIGITTPAAAKFTTLTTTGNSALGDAEATDTHAIKGATTLLANSASPALTIAQTGAGDVLRVEDSSGDASPFLIDSNGNVVLGHTSYQSALAAAPFQINISGINTAAAIANWNTSTSATPRLGFLKSNSGTVGTSTGALLTNTRLMDITAYGDDGAGSFAEAARIRVETDAASSGAVMPTRYTFVMQDSSGVLQERFRIDSSGQTLVTGHLRSTTDVRANGCLMQTTSPVNSNVSATLAASTLVSGIATGTPAEAIDFTLPTGTNLGAVFSALQNNQTFEWSVINLAAATHAISVLANTNHSVVGNMVVNANSSGRFGTRKSATNTFITYRLA